MIMVIYTGEAALANELLPSTKGHGMGWGWTVFSFGFAFFPPLQVCVFWGGGAERGAWMGFGMVGKQESLSNTPPPPHPHPLQPPPIKTRPSS
jgi:hypothetical protein